MMLQLYKPYFLEKNWYQIQWKFRNNPRLYANIQKGWQTQSFLTVKCKQRTAWITLTRICAANVIAQAPSFCFSLELKKNVTWFYFQVRRKLIKLLNVDCLCDVHSEFLKQVCQTCRYFELSHSCLCFSQFWQIFGCKPKTMFWEQDNFMQH